MGSKSAIQWTDASWTPLRARRRDTGKVGVHCEKVSAGCANCYSETFNRRNLPNQGTGLRFARDQREKVDLFLDERILSEPLRWKRPRRIFVCSQTDLFGEFVTDEQIDRVFAVMALAPTHTFQVLTKRAERMRAYFSSSPNPRELPDRRSAIIETLRSERATSDQWLSPNMEWPLHNVWLGVSCEDQATADERIPHLLATPTAVRFVSAEPLLGPVTLFKHDEDACAWTGPGCFVVQGRTPDTPHEPSEGYDDSHPGLDWVIVGGESGPGARPCDVAWIRTVLDQCRAAGVAPFIKQLGSRPVAAYDRRNEMCWRCDVEGSYGSVAGEEHEHWWHRLRDRKGGEMSEWPADLRVRLFPQGGTT